MPPSQLSSQEEQTADAAPPSPSPSPEKSNPATTSPPPSPPHVNPAEAKKIASMQSKIAVLEAQIKEIEEKQNEVDAKLKSKDAQTTVKVHIKLLHDYNEIRDIGQGLMGIIADNRGVRVSDVYRDFEVGEGD